MTIPHHRVAIVGAGFAGIGLATRLLQRGTSDFVVLERGNDVGGTWRDNTYPGATCDVPSNLYSFSFAPNPSWSRSFSPQPEIETYLRRCAEYFGVLPHVRFRHEVTSARWDDDEQRWLVETTAGPLSATVLVSARGPLSEPSVPDLPGLSRFAGTIFHSARWRHDHDLSAERVAVVGTGASAIQFVPEIQPVVDRLHVFQRTPPWVIPRRDRQLSAAEHAVYRTAPSAQLAARAAVYWGREVFVAGFVGDRRRRAKRAAVAVKAARSLLHSQVADPVLRQKLTPSYELGCKRILLSNEWYPALTKPNVEVVTDTIAEVREHSIVTEDGAERPVDTIIFGTGFDVAGHAAAESTTGAGGRTLADAWAERLCAYKGTTVAGFPNLFLMVGPNTGLGHSSIVFIIESQIAYVLGALDTMRREGLASVDVRPAAQASWAAEMDRRSSRTVWTDGGCLSYYLDAAGRNVALWPGTSWGYRRRTRRFDAEAYRLCHAAPPKEAEVPTTARVDAHAGAAGYAGEP